MNKRLENDIALLSTSPGCYLMHDKNDKIIYVGKAKNLKNRVSQYFSLQHYGKVGAMVKRVDHFETILTKNENEAFLLELNLIHKYMPRYNILLKDNKRYPYIALKKGRETSLRITRNTKSNKYLYFGPYPKSSSAFKIMELLNTLYPTKKCKKLPKKACLYYYMGQCLAPCINTVSVEQQKKIFNDIKAFLSGKTYEKEQELKKKMIDFSNELNYEQALACKKLLEDIQHIKTNQIVEFDSNIDMDCFAYVVRDEYIAIALFVYRNGVLLGKDVIISELFGNETECVSGLIYQFYEGKILPKKIIVYSKELYDSLLPAYDKHLSYVTKGKFFPILNNLISNASKTLDDYFMTSKLDEKSEETISELGKLLNINFPSYIELFDNSHISGSDAVGVSVAFVNGEPCKKLYRKYHLNNENTADDLENMKEVLYRKYKSMIDEKRNLPDIILLDGGSTQISAAKEIFDKLNLKVPFYGLFKDERHQTNGIVDLDGVVYPVDHKSNIFYLISNMQNEVHRFAITFHRKTHSKNLTKSVFDDVPGIGETRKRILYDTYKDIHEIEKASIEELSQIVPLESAKKLYKKIHKN